MTLAGSAVWDDNVFRLPSSAPGSSDRIATASIGLHINKPYGQQRFLLNATQGAVRYQKLTYLDFDPLSYDGAWLWHLTPRLSGTLSASRTQSLYRFEDTHNITQRIVTTAQNRRFSVDGWMFGGWHLVAAALYDESSNSTQVAQTPNYRSTGGEAGVNYVARSGNSIRATYRTSRGDYDRSLDAVSEFDDGFQSRESELLMDWRLGAASHLNARAAWYDYQAAHFSARDFSGPVGSVSYQWTATAKLAFVLSASRTLEAYWADVSSCRATDTFSIASTWMVSARIRLSAELAHLADNYRNPLPSYPGPLRRDSTRRALVGVGWSPLRGVTLAASVRREQRDSNLEGNDYKDTLTSVTASVRF